MNSTSQVQGRVAYVDRVLVHDAGPSSPFEYFRVMCSLWVILAVVVEDFVDAVGAEEERKPANVVGGAGH